MRLVIAIAVVASTLYVALASATLADEFVLTSGATIRGEWLNRKDRSAAFYLISTEYGGQLQLDSKQVTSVRRRLQAEADYERFSPKAADTIDDQWKLGVWCRRSGLPEQAAVHFRRVIELDPQHVQARRFLGYGEIDGQWVTQEEHLKGKGYVRYKGKWRLPEHIELEKSRRTLELARKGWYAKLKLWRSQLRGDRRHDALKRIREIRDPLAVEGLGKMLTNESDRRMRAVYVEVLGEIEGTEATKSLLELALGDRDQEIFHACVEALIPRQTPDVVRQLAYALKDNDNRRVNRAAHVLSEFGDKSVISPLIDALVTTHRDVAPPNGATTTAFTSGPQMPSAGLQRSPSEHFTQDFGNGGATVSQGGCAKGTRTYQVPNQEVLKALAKLTGVSFSFDQQAWRNWLAIQQRQQPAQVNVRRSS